MSFWRPEGEQAGHAAGSITTNANGMRALPFVLVRDLGLALALALDLGIIILVRCCGISETPNTETETNRTLQPTDLTAQGPQRSTTQPPTAGASSQSRH